MADFTPIQSQEEFDNLIKDRIDRAKESVRKEFADYENIKTSLATKDAEITKLKEAAAASKSQLDDLTAKLSASEAVSAKTRIALEMGIPAELIDRLAGSNEEEIRKDAENLLGVLKLSGKAPHPKFSPENNGADAAYKNMLRGLISKD